MHARKLVLATVLMFVLLGAVAGWAYWTAGSSGSGSAITGTLSEPTNVSASSPSGSSTVHLTSTASVGGTVAPTGYYARRWNGSCAS